MTTLDATAPLVQAAPTRETLHLWGAPAAGKTGLLGALYATSKSREPDRWEAHPKDSRDAYTQEQLLDAYEQLLDRAVAKTDVRKDGYRPIEFLLRQYRKGAATGDTLRLSIVDPAGEYSTRAELGHTEHGKALFARVANGGGLLWLFSAGAPSSLDRLVVLRHLVALLEHAGGPQLGIPVGLCLSKVDALPPDRREAALADPRAALLEHLGPTTFTWFEAACPRLRCFAISSAGTEPGRVRPVGLLPTLSWFAAEINAPPAAAPAPPPPAPPSPAFTPDAPFATVEVPIVSRQAARGGVLGALASRLASAGMVPDPGANGATVAMPAVRRGVGYGELGKGELGRGELGKGERDRSEPAPRAVAAPEIAVPAFAPPDVAPSEFAPSDLDSPELAPPALRTRLARAALSGALALVAIGAGAFAAGGAVRAAGERWQSPDAPPAMMGRDESPAARRFQAERERDQMLRYLRGAVGEASP
ncbi:hypothetical protein [Roseisolibacter sp. H3M3-2]|uniref:hypothetical protein n=1 Tax=Roseisolibacter sp. H3M3-2 TaxID=3031323 RepID=UPI0023DB2F7E|nr:hypothetical protein [Roseisolibacter sp. H3M3-2]MDF1506238.1 hypothetical protein [Roseisolibacter sp. H3M3-2]